MWCCLIALSLKEQYTSSFFANVSASNTGQVNEKQVLLWMTAGSCENLKTRLAQTGIRVESYCDTTGGNETCELTL